LTISLPIFIPFISSSCLIALARNSRTQHFMINTLRKLGIKGMYLYIIKAIYNKTIANITLNEEKLNPFLLNSGMSNGGRVAQGGRWHSLHACK
jgi:hypothetical protein